MRFLLLACALVGLWSCTPVDDRPSEGTCTGAHGAEQLDAPLDDSSGFHRLDLHRGDEKASLRIAAPSAGFFLQIILSDMPDSEMETDHSLERSDGGVVGGGNGGGGSGAVESWTGGDKAPAMRRGVLTFTSAARERLVGSIDVVFADDTEARCTLDLRRAYELDTDD